MDAQVVNEGRHQGGRAPYGYVVVDAGPHPNPPKARGISVAGKLYEKVGLEMVYKAEGRTVDVTIRPPCRVSTCVRGLAHYPHVWHYGDDVQEVEEAPLSVCAARACAVVDRL
jgi:hypothetical protein